MMHNFYTFRKGILLTFLLLLTAAGKSFATYLVVDINGTGAYTSIQAAINAAPVATSAANADTIYIKNGRYKEKINIPATKPWIVMIGQSVNNVILTYDDGASTIVGGTALGTQNSASVTINDSNFVAMNITFANSFGDGSQAVAVLVNSDKVAFLNCRFLGNQDTIYIKGAGTPMHYFSHCYIDGNVDFIFGSSVAVFDTCVIYGKVKPGITSTYMVAPNTPTGQTYGITFRGCSLAGNTPAYYYYLGRPWQGTPNAVYLATKVYGNMIIGAGWSGNSAGTATLAGSYFAEYQSMNGNGTAVDVTSRVSSSYQLTGTQAAAYSFGNMFGNWNPCALFNCASFTPDIALTNMKAVKGATTFDTIRYNVAWPIAGVQYQLYRSSDNINYTALSNQTITALNDTTWNFQFIDTIPSQGNIYWYSVKGTKTGYNAASSDTVKISSAPTILTAGTLTPFGQYLGSPTAPQTYTVSGTNLTANVGISAPTNYEISTNGGASYSATASLAPTSGTLAATTVYIRQNATALGTYGGNIQHTSTGATTVTVPVSGSTIAAPVYANDTLEMWTLVAGNTDSAAVRAAGVSPSIPTLNKFYNSTATAVTTIPAYSATFGNAFGASSTLDGGWATANGGNGGNLNRTYYQQFTVKGATADSLRVDSILLTSAFYATASNTKLAVVYSKSGFVSDSTDVSGGSGPAGTLASSANGGFATPIILGQQNTGPTNMYRLALNGPLGVKTDTGGTITVRLYYACGSTSSGRYAMLKNVLFVGDYMVYVPCVAPTLSTTTTAANCAGTGGAITLGTTAGSTPFTYAWTGPNNYTSTTQSPGNLAPGTYSVTVTANGGCTATTSATVGSPTFTTTASALGSTSLCTGGSVMLKAGNIAPGNTYLWKNNGNVIAGATDTTYTVNAAGSYSVTVTNGSCSAVSSAIAVMVTAPPATTVTPAGPLSICSGSNTVLHTNNNNGLTYQWMLNNANIVTNGLDSTYTASIAGSYTVVVTATGSGCSATSSAVLLSVNPLPVTTVTTIGSATFCQGDSVLLKAFTASGNAYIWKNNGVAISGATDTMYTAKTSGSYTVTITNGSCAATSASAISVTANPLPLAAVTPAGPSGICSGNTITLHTNSSTGLSYQWKKNSINITTSGTDSTYIANATGSYTVAVTTISTGCTATSTAAAVTVNPLPVATVTTVGSLTFCQGDSLRLKAVVASGNTYVWKNNGIAIPGATDTMYIARTAGSYTVTITNGTCSATSSSTAVSVTTPPAASVTPSGPAGICNGSSITLHTNNSSGLTYQWKLNGTNIAANSTDSTYKATAAGSYTVSVASGSCASLSAGVTVTVIPRPANTVTAAGPLTFCQGDSVKLKAVSEPGNVYAWRIGSNVIAGAADSSFIARNSGTYSVLITNTAGCKDSSAPSIVSVQPLPAPQISYAGAVLSTGTYASYQWYRNGKPINGANSGSLMPSANGSYTVKVDSGICANTSPAFIITGVGVTAVLLNGEPVSVYPNPAFGIVRIKAAAVVNAELKDMSGRHVISITNAKQIDLSELSDGVYLLSITTPDGRPVLHQRLTKASR